MSVDLSRSVDLVVSEERLFTMSLDELRDHELRMAEQAHQSRVPCLGAAYVLRFQEQYAATVALRNFVQTNPSYSPLADGQRVLLWIKANLQPVNRNSLINAFKAIKLMDEIVPVIPPTITEQPADQSVEAGEAVVLTVSVSGTTPMTYQWLRDGQPILGGTKGTYITPATEFNDGAQFTCVISNEAGSVESASARLKTIYKETKEK